MSVKGKSVFIWDSAGAKVKNIYIFLMLFYCSKIFVSNFYCRLSIICLQLYIYSALLLLFYEPRLFSQGMQSYEGKKILDEYY